VDEIVVVLAFMTPLLRSLVEKEVGVLAPTDAALAHASTPCAAVKEPSKATSAASGLALGTLTEVAIAAIATSVA